MQFLVIAYDFTDDQALSRRMAVRDEHLKNARELYDSGKWLFASGILNDDGQMIGSMIVCDFPSRDEMQKHWLDEEVYVSGNVWKSVEIRRTQVAPFCMK